MASAAGSNVLYHDSTTLDSGVSQASRPHQNDPTSERITGQGWRSPQHEYNVQRPAGADPSVVPTISYRGVGPNADPRMHRSFSQRAKGRPFVDEAFLSEQSEDLPPHKTQRTSERSVSAGNSKQSQVQTAPLTDATPIKPRARRGPDSGSEVREEQTIEYSKNRTSGPVSSPKSATLKDAGNQTDEQQRHWAPDRSPLQKLEVKLTDISKEEKRARVQEAEMRLRESQASRKNQQQIPNSSRSVSQPNPVPLQSNKVATRSAPDRSGSTIVIGSASNEVGSPQSRRKRQQRQGPITEIPVRQYSSSGHRVPTSELKQENGVQKALDAQQALRNEVRHQSASSRAYGDIQKTESAEKQVPLPISTSQKRALHSSRGNDRPVSERERNASHQAALQQLTGHAPADAELAQGQNLRQSQPQVEKASRSKRVLENEDSPVSVDIGTLAGEPPFIGQQPQRSPQQLKSRSTPGQQSQPVVGLGVRSPPLTQSSNLRSSDDVNASRSRQRKSSVSFKEPFDTRRPVDEWKTAETASLTAEDFLVEEVQNKDTYKAWWEQGQSRKSKVSQSSNTYGAPPPRINDRTAVFNPPLHLRCGPLLRYAGLRRASTGKNATAATKEHWRGTIMIVTQDSRCSYSEIPTLRLFSQPKKLLPPPPALVTGDQLAPEYIDPIAGLTKLSRDGRALYVRPVDHLEEAKDLSQLEDDNGIYEASPSPLDLNGSKEATSAATNKRTLDTDGEQLGRYKEVKGIRIYADPDRDVTFWRFNVEIELGPQQQHIAYRINKSAAIGFWVPAQGQTMNMMFHSCNGFSVSVDTESFSGPDPLWRDVLNNHQTRPFHVMIGGGDQVYNDRVMVDTQLFGEWTRIRNPHHKHQVPFTAEMKNELENFYLNRYAMWFSQGLFGMANASIPMVNIWDDHDIIDGFGSYPDDFMKSPVFCGLGEVAHKYYLLFQHQTIDAITEKDEPSWILGTKPGPYIHHLSRSVYLELGQHVAFLGLDCRTERTRHDVLSDDTLEAILERCRREMIEGQTKHLIVLLGVPIAYPRLVWLENMLTSKALDPIKALHRAGIVKTKLLNKFDGGVEILDDLDDHWTATHHKVERNILIQDLQDLAAEKSARVTILSGDVHLAAVGRFYSNPKLKIPIDKDHRYMPNIISSAIVNTPPPDMLADVLNKRNKVHHLNKYTDEDMVPMFTHDVDDKKRNNTRLLPRRNWCSIREYNPGETPPPTPPTSPSVEDDDDLHDSELVGQHPGGQENLPKRRLSLTKNDFNPRSLIRRFSSRGAPPNSYKQGGETGSIEPRAASLDGVDRTRLSNGTPTQPRSSSADNVADVPALRPTFFRRPTNLAEKAARKGVVPAIDDKGNEIHFNDHINLQGGLDIVLNCEVDQKDPAGITNQYRLLVPALWYDGSSDREKINAAPQLARRNTFLQKFGLPSRRGNRPTDSQGEGDWGQDMSETESFTDSEGDVPQPPKKRFSLFGSKRKKQQQQQQQLDGTSDGHDQERNGPDIEPNNFRPSGIQAPTNPPHHSSQFSGNRTVEPPIQEPQHFRQSQMSAPQPTIGLPHHVRSTNDSLQEPRRSQNSQGAAPQQSFENPSTIRSTSRSLQAPQLSEFPQSRSFQAPQQSAQTSLPGMSSQRSSQRSNRPLSYIIGGGNDPPPLRSDYSSTRVEGRPPYDPDAAYISNQHHHNTASVQRSSSLGQAAQPRSFNPNTSNSTHSNSFSNPNPPLTQLRGNGIIGKNVPPTSFPTSNENASALPEHPGDSRGYSGIEAYKESKPRRRWSLRERARNVMSSFNRGRNDDEEWYSDEEEEAYWEGQGQGHGRDQSHDQGHPQGQVGRRW